MVCRRGDTVTAFPACAGGRWAAEQRRKGAAAGTGGVASSGGGGGGGDGDGGATGPEPDLTDEYDPAEEAYEDFWIEDHEDDQLSEEDRIVSAAGGLLGEG